MAQRFATRIGVIRMNRFARIDSQKNSYFHNIGSRKGFCRNPRGIFPTEFPGENCRGFFGGFFRAFFLGKTGRKNPPKNPRQFSNQNLGVSGPKSTLQGSGLDIGRRLMHHQNVSLQNAPSKRTLLTSLKRSKAGPPQLKRSKKYVLMVHFAVIRFDGASGASQ